MRRFITPLLGLFIFSLASGYLMTLVSLRMNNNHSDDILSGYMGAVYYLGLLAGSFRSDRTVVRINHIRSFSAFIALLCSSVLSLAVFNSTGSWLLLRFINGVAVAGIFVVIESWLLCESNQSNRGRILSYYMVSLYGANALGQVFVEIIDTASLMPFVLLGILFSLSILPIALTKIPSPEINSVSDLNIIALFKLTPSGLVGCLAGGMMLGALYSLLPIYLSEMVGRVYTVGALLGTVMTGGMLLQYPVGRWSDYIDRRKVLIVVCLVGCLCCLAYVQFSSEHWLHPVLLFLIGGATFTLYPLAISHGCDHMQPEDIVAGTQGLLLSYSLGACIGPVFAGYFMHNIEEGLMIYFAIVMASIALFFLIRLPYRPAIYSNKDQKFIPMPRTTPVTAELDPRSDTEDIQPKL
ncbi:MAG: MFS transporter [Candidatus Endonucleobacter bathymodioli]|uniref:MFS transporter n=1 Tax=Candidatus Endonucleibacter bathymodioli TaxID=539814 RepID=A0AA90NV03_9GAMM|nr:MFS transporter [Candidatus Endonucleobacter bathymodioli]